MKRKVPVRAECNEKGGGECVKMVRECGWNGGGKMG